MKNQNRKQRKDILKKFAGGLLLSLSSFSLIGIGFSSWIYGNISNDNLNVNANVGNVINLGEYLSDPNINSFKVCPTGLVVDETICYAGEISIKMNLLLKNGLLTKRKDIIDTLNLKIEIKNNGSFNYFTNLYMGSLNPNIKYSFFESGLIPNYSNTGATIENNLIKTEISYTNALIQTIESISIGLIYYFDFSNYKDNFQSQIYDCLGENPLSFDLNVEVI